ncbi:hypothetical protein, partial [Stappia sp.]
PGIYLGAETHHALRLKPDHPIGAGQIALLQYAYDLFFGKSVALHLWSFSSGQSLIQTGLAPRGNVTATSFDNAGRPTVVVDWKSDVQPSPAMIDHYRAQVGAYLDMTSADRGMIVFMTSGEIIAVPSGSGHPA